MPLNNTVFFKRQNNNKDNEVKTILRDVYDALQEKGYNPVYQIVGYVLSGDPTYITGHNNARTKITSIDRDEMLEEIFKEYIDNNFK